jgi:signal transduction histidine kinase
VPRIILVAGLGLAGFAATLGVSRARRAEAQVALDRIFNLSPDLIALADLDGYVTRVNPAVEQALGELPARAELARLAEEQAALRRVAALVARDAPQAEIFAAIADAARELLGTEEVSIMRFENERSSIVVARSGEATKLLPSGTRLPLDVDSAAARVLRTGKPARIDDYTRMTGPIAGAARPFSVRCVVGSPIMVKGGVWGAIVAGTRQVEALPPDTEVRLSQFTELMTTAIANAESQARAGRLAGEQGALRRIATLVAEEQSPTAVFAKVAEEAANLFENVECALFRDSGDDNATVVAAQGADMSALFPVGTGLPTEGEGALASALRGGWPQRIEYRTAGGATAAAARKLGISSAVVSPIVARDEIWGAIVAARFDGGSCPPDTETRLAQFADLVATAIANADARAQVERLAEEQAALRRVAMLAAAGASPTAVLDAVAAEVQALLDADQVAVNRFDPGDEILVVAHRGLGAGRTPVGSRVSIADIARDKDLRSSVSAPISVEGRLWGLMTASWETDEPPPPPEAEERMVKFAELLDTAIANADRRDQLTASRARLVTAGDEARRRVVRDLHDGAQQRLVHTIVTLKRAQRALRQDDEKAEALQHAEQGTAELRELAHGILPAVLTRGGLRAGVDALVARLDLPVRVEVSTGRFPAELEASAYFIVAEALTNVMKHAHAARAEVIASAEDGVLQVEVRDDGVGGADPSGQGLVGMADRVSALGGQLRVDSPADGGTRLSATLPLAAEPGSLGSR